MASKSTRDELAELKAQVAALTQALAAFTEEQPKAETKPKAKAKAKAQTLADPATFELGDETTSNSGLKARSIYSKGRKVAAGGLSIRLSLPPMMAKRDRERIAAAVLQAVTATWPTDTDN